MEYAPGVGLDELHESIRLTAVLKASKFIQDVVLPQWAILKSDRSGAQTEDIIPPRLVAEKYWSTPWESKQAPTHIFTFCHNDLGQHSILCNQDTGNVLPIIDWEYAGHYGDSFEGSMWLKPYHESFHDEKEIEKQACRLAEPVFGM